MITKIEHIGIAVKDIEEAITLYRDYLGLECGPISTIEESGLQLVFLTIGESAVELLAPTKAPPKGSDGEMIANFIKNQGEGIHHLAVTVSDIKAMMDGLTKKGVELVDKEPRSGGSGKIAFIDSKSTYGTVLELCEP